LTDPKPDVDFVRGFLSHEEADALLASERSAMTDREILILQFRLKECCHALAWAKKYILEHPAAIEGYDREYFLHRIDRILGRGKGTDVESGKPPE
jgi:hypothetical protein